MESQGDDSQNSKVYAIILSILLMIIFPASILLMVLIFKRRSIQPLKKRSPTLILLTLTGNFLFIVAMLVQQIARRSCNAEMNGGNQQSSKTCQNDGFIYFNCFLGFFMLVFCEPLAIYPYFLRSYRLHRIFQAQNCYVLCGEKPRERCIKESFLLKVGLAIALLLLVATLLLYLVDFKTMSKELPSYTADICFLDSLGDLDPDDQETEIEQHLNVSFTTISCMYFLENCSLIYCIFTLRKIQKDFSILLELQVVLATWFICGNIGLGLFIFQKNNLYFYGLLLLVLRCLITMCVSSLPSLIQTYRGNHYIPIPPSIDCLERLDMVLHIPLAAEAFYEYLDQLEDPEAPIFFALYADLRTYDRACTQDVPADDEKYEIAEQIFSDYLKDGADYFVQISQEVSALIMERFNHLQNNLNEYLFIELYAFVLDRLRSHYDRFKMSPNFSALQKEIERQEKLYDVLVDASIITN